MSGRGYSTAFAAFVDYITSRKFKAGIISGIIKMGESFRGRYDNER